MSTKVIPPKELLEATIGGLSVLIVTGGSTGDVLTKQSDGTYVPVTPSSGGIGGSTGSVDNALLRADGTGGSTAQGGSATLSDLGALVVTAGGSTTVPTTVKAAASQSANLTEWQNSSGTVGASIDSSFVALAQGVTLRAVVGTSAQEMQIVTSGNITTKFIGVQTSGSAYFYFQNAASPTGSLSLIANTTPEFHLSANGSLTWESTAGTVGSNANDTILKRGGAAATIQMGLNSSSPISQTFKGPDGSGTNIAGGNLAIAGGQGTGTGVGGSVKIQVAPAGSTGSSANALVDALTIDSTKAAAFAGAVTIGSGSYIGWAQTINVGSSASETMLLVQQAGTGKFGITGYSVAGGSNGIGLVGYSGTVNISTNSGSHAVVAINVPSSTNAGLIVKAAASQSANLTEWQNSSGTVLTCIKANGSIDMPINGNPTIGNSTYGGNSITFSNNGSITIASGSGYNTYLTAYSSSSSTTDYVGFKINGTCLQSSVAGFTGLVVDTTWTATGSGGTRHLSLRSAGTEVFGVDRYGTLTFGDAANITLNTATGTKIGTATSQKLSLWNATPIVQPTTAIAAATLVSNGGTALTDTDTFDGYTLKQIVKALREIGALA